MKKLTQLTFFTSYLQVFNQIQSCFLSDIFLVMFLLLFQFHFKFKFVALPVSYDSIKKRRWRRSKEQEQGGNLEFLLTNWFIFICTLEPCANARRYKYGEKSKPQLECIINLLIHKHEIIIKYSNKARKAKKSEEQQKKKVVYQDRFVWFTSLLFVSFFFCTPHKRK